MRPDEKGMALMIAVWAVILIGALVAGMVAAGGSDAAIAANRIEAARARHLAEAGVQRAIAALVDPEQRETIRLGQPFAAPLQGEAAVTVVVRDSCGAIDLNWASSALLRAYGLSLGMKPAAAARFADAVVARQRLTLAPGAAELNTGPWQSVEQLAALPEMDPALLQALTPGLTINCREAGADPCCATQAVKQALSLGVSGTPSHRLAYEIEALAALASGAKARVRAAIWLSREPGPPYYYVTEWRGG